MSDNNNNVVCSGNKGKGIRSDIFVSLKSENNGGRIINLISKVSSMYANDINKQINDILDFFEIENVTVDIEDSGALPYVIAARMEAAVKRFINSEKEYLPAFIKENNYSTKRDRIRFSRLYIPGNTPSLMINAGIHKPDGIILDLEDAVAPEKKFEASFLVRNALRAVDFYGTERMVRINQVPAGLDDLNFIVPHNVNLILIPKCESAKQITLVNNKINEISQKYSLNNKIWLMPIIESALGVINSYSIASAADNIVAMAIGLEDYTADICTRRTAEGNESFFARSMIVNSCRAAGIQPIDSVFSDVSDLDGLKANVLSSKAIGFDGMGCIHPRQIKIINEFFGPDEDEISKAKKIVLAFEQAQAVGIGVVSIGTKMIDLPVVKRAQRVINLAVDSGKLDENWKEIECKDQ